MGGYGSTRWNFHSKKDTTDDAQTLSIFALKRDGLMKSDIRTAGTLTWSNSFTGKKTAAIGFELNTQFFPFFFRVYYTITRWNQENIDLDYNIILRKTDCNFGGERWWFTCPLGKNGRLCGRRSGKLYLPFGANYFGCRHCYDLTYRSSQESDKRVNALRKLGAMGIMDGIQNGDIDLLTGLKAMPDWIFRNR